MKTPSFFLVGALLVTSSLVFSGCGTNGMMPLDDYVGRPSSNGEGSTTLGSDVAIPTTFPADIPRYTGAKTQIAIFNATQNLYTVNQQTNDSVETVVQRINETMLANGFQKDSEITGTIAILTYKQAAVTFHVQVARDEQKGLTYIILGRQGQVAAQP